MQIYVAGKFEEGERVKVIQKSLRVFGHTITFDWTIEEYKNKQPNANDAQLCLQGVLAADLFVGLFVRDNAYKGALVEMGVALGQGIECCIIGHAIDSCIFVYHSLVKKFEDEDEFLGYIKCLTYTIR